MNAEVELAGAIKFALKAGADDAAWVAVIRALVEEVDDPAPRDTASVRRFLRAVGRAGPRRHGGRVMDERDAIIGEIGDAIYGSTLAATYGLRSGDADVIAGMAYNLAVEAERRRVTREIEAKRWPAPKGLRAYPDALGEARSNFNHGLDAALAVVSRGVPEQDRGEEIIDRVARGIAAEARARDEKVQPWEAMIDTVQDYFRYRARQALAVVSRGVPEQEETT